METCRFRKMPVPTWHNVGDKISGVPQNTYVSRIIASKFSEGTAYVTFDGHRSDDYKPYVYVTTDFGETWKSLAGKRFPMAKAFT